MMAAREAGCTLSDLLEMDGVEYDMWIRYVSEGASELRTQIILAQLIQMVSGALGGKAQKMENILPYYIELTGGAEAHEDRIRKMRMARHQQASDRFIDHMLEAKSDVQG